MARTSPGGSNHHLQITLPAHTSITKSYSHENTNLLHSSIPSPLRGFDKHSDDSDEKRYTSAR
ncbi:hypothetical protein CPAR01_03470 [Colletotrichum paranaense]|uniref:Uncharacterized protein n=1 Tax=Colletotrichum paranaense TaxID=1914294 RepID=A0ABQ9T2F3_9PEZI|nr:uncharacterized protein CPAR01_03470 [Colletotrichum paranaense]KAK1545968.1 hypothetical protein CPAR01_03470 [Colletotrichum paranaense]